MIKKKYVAILLVAMFAGLSFAIVAERSGFARKDPPGKVSAVTEASYIVFTDGFTVYSKNGVTGVTDYSGSSAAEVIQAGIDALGSHGGIVLIKEGTYVISSTIKVPGNVTLSGVGFATKLVLADYANQRVIENKHPDAFVDSNIVISNLQIDGNGARQSEEPSVSASAIFFTRVTESRVEGCWLHNVSRVQNLNAGITTVLSSDIIIRGNTIYDNRYAGVFLSSRKGAIVSNNIFMRNHRGVYLAGHSNAIVEGNQLSSNGEGIRMYEVASNNLITGNLIKDSYQEGILVTHLTCQNNYLVDNHLINNAVQIFDNGTDTVIRDNEGYRTENWGVTSVVNGSFIEHSLVATPTIVQLTPTTPRIVAVSFKNSTHIQVGLLLLDGTPITEPEEINWYTRV
jgi:parallel beta-helix repeat protein